MWGSILKMWVVCKRLGFCSQAAIVFYGLLLTWWLVLKKWGDYNLLSFDLTFRTRLLFKPQGPQEQWSGWVVNSCRNLAAKCMMSHTWSHMSPSVSNTLMKHHPFKWWVCLCVLIKENLKKMVMPLTVLHFVPIDLKLKWHFVILSVSWQKIHWIFSAAENATCKPSWSVVVLIDG